MTLLTAPTRQGLPTAATDSALPRGADSQLRPIGMAQYRDELCALVSPLGAEVVDLARAHHRVLAADILARDAVPVFDASAMDGYAVRFSDVATADATPVTLRVRADLPAGSSERPTIAAGECVRIMTGAPMPPSADTVVPVESTDGGCATVTIYGVPRAGRGAHLRRRGEDVRPGDLVVAAGTVLTPGALAAVAGTGNAVVSVTRRPRVVVAATGSELREPGAELDTGQIHESNSHFVGPALTDLGGQVRVDPPITDDPAALRVALTRMTADADLVVLTGGAGPGAHDVPGQVLAGAAQHGRRRVLMRPGKPQAWARWNGVPVLVLPGNPVAAAVSVAVFVAPMIDILLGRTSTPESSAIAGEDLTASPGGTSLIPARLSVGTDARVRVTRAHRRGHGSHLVTSLVGADVLAVVPAGVGAVTAGSLVRIIPFGSAAPGGASRAG